MATPKTNEQQAAPPPAATEARLGLIVAVVAGIVSTYLSGAAAKRAMLASGWTAKTLTQALARIYLRIGVATLGGVHEMARREFTDSLPTSGPVGSLVDAMVELEARMEDAFLRNSMKRIALDLRRAALSGDDLGEQLQKSLDRERGYAMLRVRAARRRVELRIEEADIRARSPEGAYWLLDPTKRTHTADCLAMAGKAWGWKVLAKISPASRHYGCGCRLETLGYARGNGLPNAYVVRNRAPRIAAHD